jgi:hypothetical protein
MLFLKFRNKNIDIKFSVHAMFLESPSSGTLKVERLKNQIILKSLRAIKPKVIKPKGLNENNSFQSLSN